MWPESVDGAHVVESKMMVDVTTLPHHYADDRGVLLETLRADDPTFTEFGQAYVVRNPTAGAIRAYHKHNRMYDWFTIIKGAAIFVFWGRTYDYEVAGEILESAIIVQRVCVRADCPKTITVPPGVWHGWTSLEDDTILLSVASDPFPHDGSEPDCTRTAWDILGTECWEMEPQ